MACTVAEALAELVESMPRLDEAIRAVRRARCRERWKRELRGDRPCVEVASVAAQ
jgi:hypothetical protein